MLREDAQKGQPDRKILAVQRGLQEEVGQRLRALRGTQLAHDIYEGIGLDPSTISRYETGERLPGMRRLCLLLAYYEVGWEGFGHCLGKDNGNAAAASVVSRDLNDHLHTLGTMQQRLVTVESLLRDLRP